MVDVLSEKDCCYIQVKVNEGVNEKYHGLHQRNFMGHSLDSENPGCVLCNKEGEAVLVENELKNKIKKFNCFIKKMV